MGWCNGFGVVLGLFLSCGLHVLSGASEQFWNDPSQLQCGLADMQFSLPFLIRDSAFVLAVLDNKGKSHYLYNNSACGTWIGEKPDGSVVVGAAYDGCFVSKKDGEYLMTITLEEISDGLVQYNKKDLKCPILPAMDAPSPSTCASIAQQDKLPCANALVSQELCERIGCCFNPRDTTMPCYYGKKLTAQCSDNIVVAVSKDLTTPSLVLESVNVVAVDSASCPKLSILKSNSFVVFQFPLSCGAKHQVDESTMIYENIIEAKQDIRTWNGASLTRDSTMRVTVQCSYSRNAVLPLKVQVFTLPPPPPVSTTGPLFLEMRIAKDQQYSSYYIDGDYPVTRVLRDPVYLEVRILQRTDPNLVLILNDCWANPSPDKTQQPQWPILVKSCPFPGDNYLTQLIPLGASSRAIPFPTHYNHFSISTFTFVDGRTQLALRGLVYFHCSALVCVPSAGNPCSTTCAQRQKRQSVWIPEEHQSIVTSLGPVNFITVEKDVILPEHSFDDNGSDIPISIKDLLEADTIISATMIDYFSPISNMYNTGKAVEGLVERGQGDLLDAVINVLVNEVTDGSTEGEGSGTPQGDFLGVERLRPKYLVPVMEDSGSPESSSLIWLRVAVAVGGVLAVTLTVLGLWRCRTNRSKRINSVEA
ncbi:zona pellucida sperm-binding protein 4-like [Pelobates fuscus]|uniref:zona pellucida sperm-binding protein 4-like n=1 Tax=Pelobates fuscus TaxID=191477 RepID=UPI002FE49EEC